jgi:hypothetical protein
MRATDRGIALIVTLLAIGLFSALGLGLALASSTARLADHNHEAAVTLLNAAESALELAARDLAAVSDWTLVLDGSIRSTAVDGLPDGLRTLPGGGSLDLSRLTNQLTCGRDTICSDAQRAGSTVERPWGTGNPRWRLFLHMPLNALQTPRHRQAPYGIVWVGDDARETDGDPAVDGGGPGGEGRYVVRARAEAFGADGARRALEAELVRMCHPVATGEFCLSGTRVASWRVVTPVP